MADPELQSSAFDTNYPDIEEFAPTFPRGMYKAEVRPNPLVVQGNELSEQLDEFQRLRDLGLAGSDFFCG